MSMTRRALLSLLAVAPALAWWRPKPRLAFDPQAFARVMKDLPLPPLPVDGIADATAALQARLDALGPPDAFKLPPGIYRITLPLRASVGRHARPSTEGIDSQAWRSVRTGPGSTTSSAASAWSI